MQKTIIIQDGDKFVVTGKFKNNKNFKAMTFSNWRQAQCINLWRGNRWLLRDGKRTLIESVYN